MNVEPTAQARPATMAEGESNNKFDTNLTGATFAPAQISGHEAQMAPSKGDKSSSPKPALKPITRIKLTNKGAIKSSSKVTCIKFVNKGAIKSSSKVTCIKFVNMGAIKSSSKITCIKFVDKGATKSSSKGLSEGVPKGYEEACASLTTPASSRAPSLSTEPIIPGSTKEEEEEEPAGVQTRAACRKRSSSASVSSGTMSPGSLSTGSQKSSSTVTSVATKPAVAIRLITASPAASDDDGAGLTGSSLPTTAIQQAKKIKSNIVISKVPKKASSQPVAPPAEPTESIEPKETYNGMPVSVVPLPAYVQWPRLPKTCGSTAVRPPVLPAAGQKPLIKANLSTAAAAAAAKIKKLAEHKQLAKPKLPVKPKQPSIRKQSTGSTAPARSTRSTANNLRVTRSGRITKMPAAAPARPLAQEEPHQAELDQSIQEVALDNDGIYIASVLAGMSRSHQAGPQESHHESHHEGARTDGEAAPAVVNLPGQARPDRSHRDPPMTHLEASATLVPPRQQPASPQPQPRREYTLAEMEAAYGLLKLSQEARVHPGSAVVHMT